MEAKLTGGARTLIEIAGRVLRWLEFVSPLVDLAVRLYVANVFWKSGLTKISSWDTTIQLFTYEYRVPVLSPEVAAVLATAVELGGSVLLALGFASRLGTA